MGRFMSLRVIAWALRAAGLLMGIGVGLALCSALIPGDLGFFRMPSPLEGVFLLGAGLLYALLLYRAGELIELLLAIEDHVRTMAEHFRRQGPPPAAS
jgi:hypothetical protein